MARAALATAALVAVAGFAVCWLVFSEPGHPVPRPAPSVPRGEVTPVTPRRGPGAPAPDPTGNVTVIQRFALPPADLSADREAPAIAVAPDGSVVVAWTAQATTTARERTLFLARSDDAGLTFSMPRAWRSLPIHRTIEDRPDKEPNRDVPTHILLRLDATGDTLALSWVEATDGGPSVRYLVARSSDGGRTFAPPVSAEDKTGAASSATAASRPRPFNPASRGTQAHSSFATADDGAVHSVWEESLEGQQPAADQSGHSSPGARGGRRAIVYAVSRDGGQSFSSPHVLVPSPRADQTRPSLAVAADGTVYVAWNEIDQDGMHIVVARLMRTDPTPERRPP
jgi:hypothetical protein